MLTIVNPWHWLTEDGDFPPSPRLRRLALRVAQCIEYGGPLPHEHGRETLIPCRFRPQRKPCPGLLWVVKLPDDAILACCDTCRAEEFLIHDWHDTLWAEGVMPPIEMQPENSSQS